MQPWKSGQDPFSSDKHKPTWLARIWPFSFQAREFHRSQLVLGKLVFTARHLEILLYSSQLWRMVLKIQRKKHIWVWLEKQRGKMYYMLNRNGKCSLQNNMDTLFTKRILLLKRNCIGFHVSPFKKTPPFA